MDEDRQYLNHFSLITNPFRGLTDRRFIWLGQKQLENLAYLKIGIEQTRGILFLIGEEGSGKSVLLESLLKILGGDLLTVVLREPEISVSAFFDFLSASFKIEKQINTKAEFFIHFREFLLEAHASGKRVLLIVEDAENQNDDVIEQTRLLSNFEDAGNKLLSILLIGNKDLIERLQEHRHRALLQRVAVRRWVAPLSEKETGAYIRHRVMVAGCFLEIFTAEAVRAIHSFSGGLPKLIDLVCDHTLMRGYFKGVRTVDGKIVEAYVKEIRKGFRSGSSDPRFAALKSLPPSPEQSRKSWSSKMKAAAIVLAVILLLGVVIHRVGFEKETGIDVNSAAPTPVNLYFEAGSAKLSARDHPILDGIAEYLIQNHQSQAIIKGYPDSKASTTRSLRIADMRVKTAKEYLVQRGVDPAKIQTFGMGSKSPAGDARPVEDQKFYSRVEIEVDTAKNAAR